MVYSFEISVIPKTNEKKIVKVKQTRIFIFTLILKNRVVSYTNFVIDLWMSDSTAPGTNAAGRREKPIKPSVR